MKKIFLILAAIFSASLLVCCDDEVVNTITDPNPSIFSISPVAITPTAEGGEYELKISGDKSWKISLADFNTGNQEWIKFSKTEGTGAEVIKVTIDPASSFVKRRSVMINVVADSKKLQSKVLQATMVLGEDEVLINGVIWSTTNVGAPGEFVSTPDEPGMLYQFNRKVGYPHTPAEAPSNWPSTYENDTDDWTAENDPSPEGWRVPTTQEMVDIWNIGSTWVEPAQTGFSLPGMIVGIPTEVARTATKDNLKQLGGVFLPMVGWRNEAGVMDRTWLVAVRSGTSLQNISGNDANVTYGGMTLGDAGGYRDLYGWGDGPKIRAAMVRSVKKVVIED